MRVAKRVLFGTATAAVMTLPMVVSWSVAPVDETACTAAQPPAGFVVKKLTGNNDEYVVPDDGKPYIIYAGAGQDVVVGGPQGDILCGSTGHDGLNGRGGDDIIVGGEGYDMLSGAGGNDVINGGDDDDALYGGADNDVLLGELGSNYVRGGPGVNVGDADTAVTVCPPSSATWYAARMGAYRPERLEQKNTCKTIEGYVIQGSKSDPDDGDGDQHFKVGLGPCVSGVPTGEEYAIEFMPRDKPHFNNVIDWTRATCSNPITLTGAYVLDCDWHKCLPGVRTGKEIHPVFQMTYRGTTRTSGPQYGGSPWNMNPDDDRTQRYCWSEMGSPCRAWPNNDPFL
ncbi:MAG TPA: calcium-binding protein [Frankiaceae bacterium]|nr:calcium-binding protein [Frankiaceae bacterium]